MTDDIEALVEREMLAWYSHKSSSVHNLCLAVAHAAVKLEREACAELVGGMGDLNLPCDFAAAIRARGEG